MRTFQKQSLTLNTAKQMIAKAEAKAGEIGMEIAIAIVDESGILKAFSRMDGAALVAVDLARKKAITAVGFGLNTGTGWNEFVKNDPILLVGVQNVYDFTMFGGGLPIFVDGEIVGGIGVSGGHYAKDEECAKAGIEALGSTTEPA